ncbi:hypothetical protein MTR67_050326 [Solanum verrucosum]|uniref:DUF4220 domain-containing protein n=2 Tax=Solanum verrucosum TaxID=315347 RepID=A0AAF0ZZ58_SOLVR|nr:hypothetical protein MTR67_050326 [Solanum verrucosum]
MFSNYAASVIFVNAERRRLIEVIPDSLKKAWKDWEVEVLILGSLIFQIVLILFGKRRQCVAKLWIRMTLWTSYLLADWIAIVALGIISQNTLDKCKQTSVDDNLKDELMSFWAPFMLLHLGGPDTITAYSLEDNELWLRHLVGLIIQSGLTFYILLVSLPGSSWLPFLSLFIFISGLIKFSERTCALRSAKIENLRDSMLTSPDPGPNYAKFMEEYTLKKAEGFYVMADEVKEISLPIDHSYHTGRDKLLLISEAFDQFQTFKRLFVDLILSFQDRDNSRFYFKELPPKEAFDVIEAELGFAYDTFYTKAPVIFTPLGCILRVVTFSCIFFSLISFSLCKERLKYHKLDLILTYLLLVVALLLEIYALIVLLNSDWTKNLLSKGKQDGKFYQSFLLNKLCLRRSNKMRWSNCTPQYNLLSYCVDFKPPRCYRFQKLFQINELLEKHMYKKYELVSPELKELIFNHFQKFAGESNNEPDHPVLCTSRGTTALTKNDCSSLVWSTEVEFDQSFLIWHIATDLCYYTDDGSTPCSIKSKQISKQLSDYMLYLLVVCPFMLPIGLGMIRFRDTCAEAKEFFTERKLGKDLTIASRKLLTVNTEVRPAKVKGDRSKSVLFDACILAKSLKEKGNQRKWEIISEVWVEMLAYAATHCRGNHHAQQLRKGGELLTHVWLLMAHLGITEQFQINRGHARAKLIVK